MGLLHPITPAHRMHSAVSLLAHAGEYGVVTALSRATGVSRPTLYAWREQAHRALLQTFAPPAGVPLITPPLEREVLTLWVQAHASTRAIQTCLATLTHRGISLETITRILHTAEQRALAWVDQHAPPTLRALALDEIYANDRQGAYLNVVDVHSGAVWASEGPVAVDTESWTLVLWEVQARGVRWNRVVMDGGTAMQAACRAVRPDIVGQHDQWHVLHSCAQLQARLERRVATLRARTAVVARQAARVAAGQPPKGRNPQTDVTAHAATVAQATRVVAAMRYLMQEVHRLLEVVVVDRRGVLDGVQRREDLAAALALLDEVAAGAPAGVEPEVHHISRLLCDAVPSLLTFVEQVAQVQQDLLGVLPAEQQALVGWAWLRRKVLGWSEHDLVAALPEKWRAGARILLACWEEANLGRVSSAVERWHSILRPHLAVHRVLARGRLALLAVWHNHRVFKRGVHKGKSPLHLSGLPDAPSDWLVALGYPPAEAAAAVPPPADPVAPVLALAA